MERLRKTLSFRRKKKTPESSKPHQWQEDEKKVREGTCSFQVKYLGSVEVFESRGMQVCEDAVKVLYQNMKKATRFSFRKKPRSARPVYATLYISGDSLRVVEDRGHMDAMSRITSASDELNKGLIVDQTIEKVSFCAPDRNHEKAFAYICRDGTTRRWLCHAFLALKESGERLSHAVGCAFAVCLEKKQKREREAVQVTYSDDKTTFTRMGSFRQTTLTERMLDPQSAIVPEPVPTKSGAAAAAAVSSSSGGGSGASSSNSKPAVETAVRERPQATPDAFLRLGSFREFPKLSTVTSPFKRQLSLRLNELPSNLDRQQHDLRSGAAATSGGCHENEVMHGSGGGVVGPAGGASLAGALTDPTTSKQQPPIAEPFDPIAAMCQQLSQGLSSMTAAGGGSNLSSVPQQQQPVQQSQWPTGAAAAVVQQQQPAAMQWSATATTANGWQLHAVTTTNPPALASSSARPAGVAGGVQLSAKPGQQQQPPPQPLVAGAPPGHSVANQPTHPTAAAHGAAAGGYWSSAASSSSVSSATTQHRPATAPGHTKGAAAAMMTAEADPFDAAWAMRSTASSSTNPFLPGPQQQQQHQQHRHRGQRTEVTGTVTKTFEMKM